MEKNFDFKKDENKKLIYISLGTIFNYNVEYYKNTIGAFGNSENYQVIMSVGKFIDIKSLGDIPNNFFIYNYVPQLQISKQTNVFITHGGINSKMKVYF